ncbi:MAG: hypothetical protein ACYCYK_13435 [Candidatus Dormibacteria bacterium]
MRALHHRGRATMGALSALIRPDHGTGPHPHRSWLHLLAVDPRYVPSPQALEEAVAAVVRQGLAIRSEDGVLRPGPEFVRCLSGAVGPVPPSASRPPRGSVSVEAGIWRCYPDPGPQGFESEPVTTYLTPCPNCGVCLNFFLLRFPHPDPHRGVCARCGEEFSVLAMPWCPDLPMGRFEVTFGDLASRPTLRGHPVFPELEEILGVSLREAHVTL